MEAAFARLMRIRTLRTVVIGFAALGFSLFTVPVLASLYMEDEFGLERLRTRHRHLDRRLRRPAHPAVARAALRSRRTAATRASRCGMIGRFIVPMAIVSPLQFLMPEPISFTVARGDPQPARGRRPSAW